MKLKKIIALLLALVLVAALPCGAFAAADSLAQARADAKASFAQPKADMLAMLNMYVNDGAMSADQGTAYQTELNALESSIGNAIDAAADQPSIEGLANKFPVLAQLKLELALRMAGIDQMENLEAAEKQQAKDEACKWVTDAIAAIEQASVPGSLSVADMQLKAAVAQAQMQVNGHKFDYYFDIARNAQSLDSSVVAAAQQEMTNVTNAAMAAIGSCSSAEDIYMPQGTGMVSIDLTWWKLNEKERMMGESCCNELTGALDGYVADGLLTQEKADEYKTAMQNAKNTAFAAIDAVALDLSAITGCAACQNGAFDCKQFPAGDCQNYSTQCDCHTVWDAYREAEAAVTAACDAGIAAVKAALPAPTEADRAAAIAAVTAELDSVATLMRSCTNMYAPEDVEAVVAQFLADQQYILDTLNELDLNGITVFALQQMVDETELEMARCRAELTVYDAFTGSVNDVSAEIIEMDGELTDAQKEVYLQQIDVLWAPLEEAVIDAPAPEDIYAAGEQAQAELAALLADARAQMDQNADAMADCNSFMDTTVPAAIAEISEMDGELTDDQKTGYIGQIENIANGLRNGVASAVTTAEISAAVADAQAALAALLAEARDLNEKFKTVNEELTTVPAEISGQYSTVLEIENKMVSTALSLVAGLEPDKAQTVLMDVTLQVNNGGVWEDVEPDAFPSEGVTVLLPYPAGTDASSHNFVIAHMITHGPAAGTVELLPGTPTAEGIQVTFTSLSPVAVLYQEKPAAPTPPQNDPPAAPVTSDVPATPAPVAPPKTADATGTALWCSLLLVSAVALAGVCLCGKKKYI